ncbi:hypothetical protein TrST_g8171, partial [Triparma strigata]
VPELVGTDELGMKSIRYLGFTPVILEAVKEQQAEIEELKVLVRDLMEDNILIREELEALRELVLNGGAGVR